MSDFLYTGTTATGESEALMLDKLNEAMELIKALAPKESPNSLILI